MRRACYPVAMRKSLLAAGLLALLAAPDPAERRALVALLRPMAARCAGVSVDYDRKALTCFTQAPIAPGFPGVRQVVEGRAALEGTAFTLPPAASDPAVALVYKGGRPVTYAELDRALSEARSR